jgi:hypothetical protein
MEYLRAVDRDSDDWELFSNGSTRTYPDDATVLLEELDEAENICYWPVWIFLFIFIIILLVCGCTCYAGSYGSNVLAAILFFIIIWALVLWFFCRSGNTFAAWFFLLLAIAVLIVWVVARYLDGLC